MNSSDSCSNCAFAEKTPGLRGDLLVCSCNEVFESTVRAAVDGGSSSVEEVTAACGAGGGCQACHVRIERVLRGMPAKCGSGRFDLCGECGCIGALCNCPEHQIDSPDEIVRRADSTAA